MAELDAESSVNETDCIGVEVPDLKELLSPLVGDEFHVCEFRKTSLGFRCLFRLKLSTPEKLKQFVSSFGAGTYVTWRTEKTNPKDMSAGRRNLFWSVYTCQSRQQRTQIKNPHKKHSGCKASMTVTLKRTSLNRKSRSKDHHIPDFPTIVHLNHEHNHRLSSADALKFRDVSAETKSKFIELFNSGYSPALALHAHKMDLEERHGDKYAQVAADRSLCPDSRWVRRLHQRMFKADSGATHSEQLASLHERVASINREHEKPVVRMKEVESQAVVAVCSPLMRRVHRLVPQSAEAAFVDASGAIGRHKHRIFFIMTHSCAGGLPLGIIITGSESDKLLKVGLELLKDLVGKEGFYGRGAMGPEVVMMGDSEPEQSTVSECFPCVTLLLSVFHVLHATWSWLWGANRKVLRADRPALMKLVQNLVCASNAADLEARYNAATGDPAACKYQPFLCRLRRLWEQRYFWAVALRQDLLVRGHCTSNEAVMRAMKDSVVHRLKAYSVGQLVDYIFSELEPLFRQRILAVTSNRLDSVIEERYLPSESAADGLDVIKICDDHYEVINEKTGKKYQVNTTVSRCTCRVGITGTPCKHQYSVVKRYKCDNNSFVPQDNPNMRLLLHYIATGLTTVSEEWNKPFCEDAGVAEATAGPSPSGEDEGRSESPSTRGQTQATSPHREQLQEVVVKLRNFCTDLEERTEKQPETYLPAMQEFLKNYFDLKTDAARLSFLQKPVRRSAPSGCATAVKVATTARRKSGGRGRQPVTGGCPPKMRRKLAEEEPGGGADSETATAGC